MSMRERLAFEGHYFPLNREERNFAAILYHVLQVNNNLPAFLSHIKSPLLPVAGDWSLYLEYAFVRDLWKHINTKYSTTRERNKAKWELIVALLNPMPFVDFDDVYTFNKHFGARSSKEIESPSNWSMGKYDEHIEDNEEFLNTSRFKWCFNAKPDIVLHLSPSKAICIEAKLESKVSDYPCTAAECAIFSRRDMGGIRVTQMQIQQQIMQLLGVDAQFFLLQEHPTVSTPKDYSVLTWRGVFGALNLSGIPSYMRETLRLRFGV